MFRRWQVPLALTDILKQNVNPEKFHSRGRLSRGTIFCWIAGCDLGLIHRHLEIIIDNHLAGGGAGVGTTGPLVELQAVRMNNPSKLLNTSINLFVISHHWLWTIHQLSAYSHISTFAPALAIVSAWRNRLTVTVSSA